MPVRRPDRGTLFTFALISSGLLAVSWPVDAQEAPADKLHSVEQQIDRGLSQQDALTKQADALAVELATLRADLVQAAEAEQKQESALSDLERQVQTLSDQAAQAQADVDRNRAHEAELLAALARLARNPPEALAFGPETPTDAIRSGLLLGATVPKLQTEAAELRAELLGLRELRAEIEEKRAADVDQQKSLLEQRQRIEALITRKASLREQAVRAAASNQQQLAALGAQASSLRDLIQRLEAERQAREEAQRQAAAREAQRRAETAALPRVEPGPQPPQTVHAPAPVQPDPGHPQTMRAFAKAHGAVVYPASGLLIRHFGDPNQYGVPDQGMTIEARSGAVVVAPYDGRIEFAGPFRGYGQILIIRHSDGYHSLLAGLDRIDGTVGDWVVAGEPVGAMAPQDPKPRLYLELRHDGKPIDPLPWLATRDEKVSG